MCVTIAQNQLKDSNNRSLTRLPCSYQLMRSLYIKGKGAMLPNLPRPSVQWIGEHAYISLFECVADLLGHGLDVQHICDSTSSDAVLSDACCSNFLFICASIYYLHMVIMLIVH